MTLPIKDYYNLIKTPLNQVKDIYTINALLFMLEDHSFIFRCHIKLKKDIIGKVVVKKLI
jgi:hypothetical protein